MSQSARAKSWPAAQLETTVSLAAILIQQDEGMLLTWEVTCPACRGAFIVDAELYPYDIELHCPSCGLYFVKGDSPRITPPPPGVLPDRLPFHIYKPKEGETLSL